MDYSTFHEYSVLMKGITWGRDSHGLFDYESRHLTKNNLKATNAMTLRRTNNDVESLDYGSAEN